MTAHDLAFSLTIGAKNGPAALALALTLAAEGGKAERTDVEFAKLLGCSPRHLQIARAALVKGGVLTYTSGQRGRPTSYVLVGFAPKPGADLGTPAERADSLPATPAVEAPPAVAGRKPQPTDPLFDVIAELVGKLVAKNASGRVAKMARKMLAAGLTPERLGGEFHQCWGRYYKWRDVLDLSTVEMVWPTILQPPKTSAENRPPDRIERAYQTAGGNPLD